MTMKITPTGFQVLFLLHESKLLEPFQKKTCTPITPLKFSTKISRGSSLLLKDCVRLYFQRVANQKYKYTQTFSVTNNLPGCSRVDTCQFKLGNRVFTKYMPLGWFGDFKEINAWI